MDLASGWFAGRPHHAAGQLHRAMELGFPAVALLPGDPPAPRAGLERARRETGAAFSAAAWDALLPIEARAEGALASCERARAERAAAMLPSVLEALGELGARILIVTAGASEAPGARERGERILARLAAGEPVLAGDEALEELLRLPPGIEERQLEALARFLFLVRRRAPGLVVAVATEASPAAVLTPAALAALLEDPALSGVAYWHDPAAAELRAELGLGHPGEWLDRFGRILAGVSLQDYGGGRDRLPPGEGRVDWPLVAEYLPRSARRVLAVAPSYPVEIVLQARSACEAFGIR